MIHLTTPRGHRDAVAREAIFSDDRKRRLWLMREWDSRGPAITVCGVNPSDADHERDDHTVMKLMRWSRQLGYGSLVMVNLFSVISPDAKVLERSKDPVGEHNDHYLFAAAETARDTEGWHFVVAWGRNGLFQHRQRIVMAKLAQLRVPTWCYAVNGDGTPSHPQRLPYTSKLLPYAFKEAA
jgi:hypothetical protein